MSKKASLQLIEHGGMKYQALLFICPGCIEFDTPGYLMLPVNTDQTTSWRWNGSLELPTLSPSIKTTHYTGQICHSFLTDGVMSFLTDSNHSLAGKSVELPDFVDVY